MPHVNRLIAVLAIAVAAAACTSTSAAPVPPPASPSVDEARATAMAEHALDAYNAGDYAAWIADWDADMKAAIGETDFLAVRKDLMATVGRYVSHGTPRLSSTKPQTFRWTFPVTFEKASATFWIAFRDGSTQIAGIKFE